MHMRTVNGNTHITISGAGLAMRFNGALIFKNVGFEAATGKCVAITGPNGSGKSTLMEIAALLRRPTAGGVACRENGADVSSSDMIRKMGFLSPRVNCYGELTGFENIRYAARSRGVSDSAAMELLRSFGLYRHGRKRVKHYSSGMRQRLKLIIAVLHNPPVLMFDEPSMNLDAAGKTLLYEYIESVRGSTAIVIATNEPEEIAMAEEAVRLG